MFFEYRVGCYFDAEAHRAEDIMAPQLGEREDPISSRAISKGPLQKPRGIRSPDPEQLWLAREIE